jgi:hypothetical protein
MRPLQGSVRLAALGAVLAALAGAAPGGLAYGGDKKKGDGASNNKGKIEGTKWSSVETTVKETKLAAGTLKLEFGKDGKLAYRIAGPKGEVTFTGKYSLGEGDKVTFHLDKELAGKKEHIEDVSIQGDRLKMTDSDGTSVTFERVGGKGKDKGDKDKGDKDKRPADKGGADGPPKGAASNNQGKIEGTKWSSVATALKGIDLSVGSLRLGFGQPEE